MHGDMRWRWRGDMRWFAIDALGFLEIRRASDMFALNFTKQFSAHWYISSQSEFKHLAAASGLSTMTYRLVSSANSRTVELTFKTISLM